MTKKQSRRPKGFADAYRDGSGFRYEATYKDKNGVPIFINGEPLTAKGRGSTKEQAKRKAEHNLEKKIKKIGILAVPDNLRTFVGFCQYWLDNHVVEYKTRVGYQQIINGLLRPVLKSLLLCDLETKHAHQLINEIRNRGLSRSMEVQLRAVGKQACDLAISLGYIKSNHFSGLKIRRYQKPQVGPFSPEEAKKIIDVARATGREAYALTAIVYGLRSSEQLALRWQDVELNSEKPHIKLFEQIQRQTGRGIVRKQLKSASSGRIIQIDESLVEALRRLKITQDTEKLVKGPQWNPEGYLFPTNKGTPCDVGADRKRWKELLIDAGVNYRRKHDARHTSSLLIGDLFLTNKLHGHASLQTTGNYYGHIQPDAIKNAISETIRTKL